MYPKSVDSVSIPAEGVDREATISRVEKTILRHRGKVTAGIALVMVIALVASNGGQSGGAFNTARSEYLEVDAADHTPSPTPKPTVRRVARGEPVLTGFGIKSATKDAYLTHSDKVWEIGTNEGIFGVNGLSESERWDFQYFAGNYYKILHAHGGETHFLKMQAGTEFNPALLLEDKGKLDTSEIQWKLERVDNGQLAAKPPVTGRSVSYYLVNVKRLRCLAITAAVNREASSKGASVTSFGRDGTGKFPTDCELQLIDGSKTAPYEPLDFSTYH